MTEAVTQSSIEQATPVPTGSVEPAYDEDAELRSVFQKVARDNGSERGDDGKFTNGAGESGDAGNADGAATAASVETQQTPPAQSDVPLPANWQGMEGTWEKIPADVRKEISERQKSIQTKMTEQGRQISAFRPMQDLIERNRDLWEGRTTDDGKPADGGMALGFLFNAQRHMEADPVGSVLEIIDRFGARNALIAALVEQGKGGTPQARQPVSRPAHAPASLSPADVARVVEEKLSEQSMSAEYSRLAASKPLYEHIDEQDMVHFILKARHKLGESASVDAVFDAAYDMAVNADPDLRARSAAASQTKPAVSTTDPKKTDAAKRANAVNVTSTSSGSAAPLSEDEELRAVFRKANKG